MLLSDKQVVYALVLAEMHRQCFSEAWSVADFQQLLSLSTTKCWICDHGFLVCSRVLDELEILTIGVLPDFRQRHIAQGLLQEMQVYAEQEKMSAVFLEVSVQNKPAQCLYSQFGFKKIGVRKNYYKSPNGPEDALCFKKTIA